MVPHSLHESVERNEGRMDARSSVKKEADFGSVPREDKASHFRGGALNERKRSRYDTYGAMAPRKSKSYTTRNGPFIQEDDSDVEDGSRQQTGLVSASGERSGACTVSQSVQMDRWDDAIICDNITSQSRGINNGAGRTSLNRSTQHHVPNSGFEVSETTATDEYGERMDFGAMRHRAEERDEDHGMPMFVPNFDDQDRTPTRASFSDISAAHQKSQGVKNRATEARRRQKEVKLPKQSTGDCIRTFFGAKKDKKKAASSSHRMEHPINAFECDQASVQKDTNNTYSVKKATKTKPPPRTQHQDWLKESKKIISRSAKHAGTLGIETAPPKVELSKPLLTMQVLPNKSGLERQRRDDAEESLQLSQGDRSVAGRLDDCVQTSGTTTPSPTPAPVGTYQQSFTPSTHPENAADTLESLVPENLRCLVKWKDDGFSWNDIVERWQRKTGTSSAPATLQKKYAQAKRELNLELHGIKMGQCQQQWQHERQQASSSSPGTASPTTIGGNTHDAAQQTDLEGLQQQHEVRPTTGGKTFSNAAFVARMAEIKAAQEEEEQLEHEHANAFFRDQSPQPGEQGDPAYFVYRVLRREWNSAQERTEAEWYCVLSPKPHFSCLIEATNAAMQESCQARRGIGPHMRFGSYAGRSDEDGLYHWEYEDGRRSGYEVKLSRELMAIGPGYQPAESMLGWFKKRVWFVRKHVESRREVQGDGMSEEVGVETRVVEEHVSGVYTTADQANRAAAEELLYFIVKKNSARLDDIEKKSTLQARLTETCKELEAKEELFEEEMERQKGGAKVKVWVEEDRLLGPRNI